MVNKTVTINHKKVKTYIKNHKTCLQPIDYCTFYLPASAKPSWLCLYALVGSDRYCSYFLWFTLTSAETMGGSLEGNSETCIRISSARQKKDCVLYFVCFFVTKATRGHTRSGRNKQALDWCTMLECAGHRDKCADVTVTPMIHGLKDVRKMLHSLCTLSLHAIHHH